MINTTLRYCHSCAVLTEAASALESCRATQKVSEVFFQIAQYRYMGIRAFEGVVSTRTDNVKDRPHRDNNLLTVHLYVSSPRSPTQLTDVQSLKGVVGVNRYVLGVVSRGEDGRFRLEDSGGVVPLGLKDTATAGGFFTGGLRCMRPAGSFCPPFVFDSHRPRRYSVV